MDIFLEIVLFAAVLYWIWPNLLTQTASRISKMVDVVTNRMFDTFSKLAPMEKPQNDTVASLNTLKRFANEQRLQRVRDRKMEAKIRDMKLLDMKESPPEMMMSMGRPMAGLTCNSCTPTSRDSLVDKTTKNLGLKNILQDHPLVREDNILHKFFPDFVQAFGCKRIVYKQIANSVLSEERVQRAIEMAASEQQLDDDITKDEETYFQKLLTNQTKRAKKILQDMRSTSSDLLFKCTSWILYKILPCFLSSVVVHLGQIEMLKKASRSGLPLIFLPLHRSHLDYVMISFILQNNGIPCPLIAAGDNLKIPVFGTLLRGLGAFYIKRRMDPVIGQRDYMYKAILHSYMMTALKAGHNLEFFMEGGRTRTGKPLMPKYGIFSIVVDAFMTGAMEDALVVPVSISYEKLVDGNFVREQLGQPKQMESFGSAIKAIWSVLKSDYGMVRIDCNQPFSFRELVETFNSFKMHDEIVLQNRRLKSNPSMSSLYGTDIVLGEYHTLVEQMTRHIMYDCIRSTSVMSTHAVAFLLLNKHRKGATLSQIAKSLDELKHDLDIRERDCGFHGESDDVVTYSLDILGATLVNKCENSALIKPSSQLPHIIELSYYANTVTTFYAFDSALALALGSLYNSGRCVTNAINEDDLIDACKEVCDIFQYEFIFHKPCQDMETAIGDCIEELKIYREVFVSLNEAEQVLQSRRLAERLFDEDEPLYKPKKCIVNGDEKVIEHLKFLVGILMPLVNAYSVTAQCLDHLVGRQVLESDLVKMVLDAIMLQLEEGIVTYEESVSSDSIKNALKLFQRWNVVESHNEGRTKLYYLKDQYDDHIAVGAVYDRIHKFRLDFQGFQL